jgi:hypothetical protein
MQLFVKIIIVMITATLITAAPACENTSSFKREDYCANIAI